MTGFVALPLAVAFATALLGGRALDRLTPVAAARWNAVLLVAVVVAAVPTFWILGLSGLTHLGVRSSICDWSAHLLPTHPLIGVAIGSAALAMAFVGAFRVARVLRTHFQIRCTETSAFHLVETSEVFAYTLPGPARTIAISRGLRQALDEREFHIVLAHEQAHARHRHDRYLLLGLIVTAAVPFMRSAADQLRFHLERWADEDAVRATGADRKLAARTIAKVALAQTPSFSLLGIANHGVAARAGALMHSAPSASIARRLQIMIAVGATVLLSVSQVHHTIEFALRTMV